MIFSLEIEPILNANRIFIEKPTRTVQKGLVMLVVNAYENPSEELKKFGLCAQKILRLDYLREKALMCNTLCNFFT